MEVIFHFGEQQLGKQQHFDRSGTINWMVSQGWSPASLEPWPDDRLKQIADEFKALMAGKEQAKIKLSESRPVISPYHAAPQRTLTPNQQPAPKAYAGSVAGGQSMEARAHELKQSLTASENPATAKKAIADHVRKHFEQHQSDYDAHNRRYPHSQLTVDRLVPLAEKKVCIGVGLDEAYPLKE